MDAELDGWSVDDVTQCENRIVSQSAALLPTGSQDEIRRGVDDLDVILRRFGLRTRLLVVERANSLALYFICLTLAALMSLRDQWRCRQLRETVQELFSFLSYGTNFLTVYVKRLAWQLSDYRRCLDFFKSIEGKLIVQ